MGDVELIERQSQPAAAVRGHIVTQEIPPFLGEAYAETMRILGEKGPAPAGPPFARFERDEGGFSVVAGFPCEHEIQPGGRVEAETLPSGLTATVLYRGDYAGVGAAYDEVQQWLTANGYAASGPPWESYLDEPEVDQPRTVVQFPCARVARE